jgi:hypothetical protein
MVVVMVFLRAPRHIIKMSEELLSTIAAAVSAAADHQEKA